MKTARILARVALPMLIVALAEAPVAFADTKTPPPAAAAGKAAQKPTTQSRSGSSTPDTSGISVAEPTTEQAIRGATAAPAGPTIENALWRFRAGVLSGSASPDSENANGDHDPFFAVPALVAVGPSATAAGAIAPPPGELYLSQMPNGNDLATAAANLVGEQSIHVALLGQHKYMLSDCLGVKVSVGEFGLTLGSPTVKIANAGVVASYAIKKVEFSAFKLRFRPDPTDLAQPCHFSGRVELGGEADDVRVELRYNPLIDVEHCKVGNPGNLDADLSVGHINLGPVPPGVADLENPFKNMIADAVNGAFFAAEQMAGSSYPVAALLEGETKAIEKVLVQTCHDVISQATSAVTGGSVAGADGAAAISSAVASNEPPDGAPAARCCNVVANSALTGRLGRIVVAFPKASKPVTARVEIRPAGGGEATASYGDTAADVLPGRYAVTINGVEVPGVTVKSRFDTQVRVGVVHLQGSARTRFDVFAPGGTRSLRSAYGEALLGFPIGRLEIGVASRRSTVTVEDGRVTAF